MNTKRYVTGLVAALSLCAGFPALAQYEPHAAKPSLDMMLIAAAIRSMDGYAEGVIRGKNADELMEMTRSAEPILASVKVVQRFKQFECARVEINVSQEKVPTRTGDLITFSMPTLGMNICADGNAPDGRIEDLPKGNILPPTSALPR